MFLCLSALAAPIPPTLHGHYAREEVVRDWIGEATSSHGSNGLEVVGDKIVVDHVLDMNQWTVVEGRGEHTFAMTSDSRNQVEVAFTVTNGVARFSLEESDWVQLDTAWPAFGKMQLNVLATGAMLSHGYLRDGEPFVVVPGWDDHTVIGDATLSGGFDFNDVFTLDGKEYLFAADATGLSLEEAAEADGPGRYALEDGEELRLERMAVPPFIVLADRLNLRAGPKAGTDRVGLVEGGTWVRVWQVKDDWLLIQDGSTLGWGSASYLGRRTSPASQPTETEPLVLEEALAEEHPIQLGPDGCDVGGRLAHVPGAERAVARLTNLDGADPLDVVCLIEGEGGWSVCPVVRDGQKARVTPCGKVDTLPGSVGARDTPNGRGLVVDGTVIEPVGTGWYPGEASETPPPADPQAASDAPEPDPEAAGTGGCLCASVALPIPLVWLILPVLVRRRRR